MLRLKRAEASKAVADEQARLARVEYRLRMIEGEGQMPDYEVIVKELDPQPVLFLREIAPEPSHIGAMIGDGYAALMPAGVMPAGPCFAVYHDPDFNPEEFDVEVAFPVAGNATEAPQTPGGRSFGYRVVPGGKAAVAVHHGPYSTIDQAYAALGTWLESTDLKMAGPPQEVYLTPPDDPSDPITEIRWPVH
jgi:effector-binding domain-containing protein